MAVADRRWFDRHSGPPVHSRPAASGESRGPAGVRHFPAVIARRQQHRAKQVVVPEVNRPVGGQMHETVAALLAHSAVLRAGYFRSPPVRPVCTRCPSRMQAVLARFPLRLLAEGEWHPWSGARNLVPRPTHSAVPSAAKLSAVSAGTRMSKAGLPNVSANGFESQSGTGRSCRFNRMLADGAYAMGGKMSSRYRRGCSSGPRGPGRAIGAKRRLAR